MLQTPLSLPMPSVLASGGYDSGSLLHRLPQSLDLARKCERTSPFCRGASGLADPGLGAWPSRAGLADRPQSHGLRTPPKEASVMNGHPLLASNGEERHHDGVSMAASNGPQPPPPPHTAGKHGSISGQSRQDSKPPPFYTSYYSARAPSPRPRIESVAAPESTRRRSSTDANSIADNLQIPSTISNGKGSLPEFAAQITCLFWFESSFTRHFTKEGRFSPLPICPLSPDAIPTTGFRKWVATILAMTQVSQNVILLALMFIYRLKQLNPSVKGKVGSEFRLLTVALMLGNKFLDDNTYTNKTWAEVSGISVQEIHVMEVEFLSNMRYTLYASGKEWEEWHLKLGTFLEYFEKASQARSDNVTRSLSLPRPNFTAPPTLPSPPISQQTSPMYFSNGTPGNATLPHPLSMPPQLPTSVLSPTCALPGIDVKPWSRKRSLEDHGLEPPAKRLSSSHAPSAASSTTLTPSTLHDSLSPVPRLPMPKSSVPAGHLHAGHIPSSASLPMPPGRAMSSVFPGPGRWPQNVILPSLQPSQYYPHPGSLGSSSPLSERPRRSSPYAHGSATSSPTSLHFSQSSQTPNGLSPSGFPAPRNSPYKPIRGVNTLLVPPSTTSISSAPTHLDYKQMHYQPLGKPISERRTGVLPNLPFPTWSEAHQLQHFLPQPQPSS